MDKLEFENFLIALGVFLSTQELRVVFETFDTNRDSRISQRELLDTLKVSNGYLKLSLPLSIVCLQPEPS